MRFWYSVSIAFIGVTLGEGMIMVKFLAKGRNLALVVLTASFVFSGCSKSGDPNSPTPATPATSSGTTTSSTTATTTTTTAGSIALTLRRGDVTVNSVSSGQPVDVSATVLDPAGKGVSGIVVNFTTNAEFGKINPAAGTALTDDSGIAKVTLDAASLTVSGATLISATAMVGSNTFTTSRGYSVGAVSVTVSTPSFGVGKDVPLSAFGSTSVDAVITSGKENKVLGNQLVTFSSACASTGKAKLTSSALSNNFGVVSASYTDLGCGASDPVTVSASGLASNTSTLVVTPPSTGSIQFVSATPTNITLKGTGGVGLQETAIVKFKVVDIANHPLGGRKVKFSLSTNVGGVRLTPEDAVSDQITGEVQVIVQSGTMSTPVRVLASVEGATPVLVTQSDKLLISTGVPDQDSVSLAVSKFNIEGLRYDGETTSLTMRLADHFNNPVPDGTAVYFTTEGGMVESSCFTAGGGCSVNLSSQEPRPADGRVTVLAYSLGEESFTDLNGNGLADKGEFKDMDEPFIDFDEDGLHNPVKEPFINFDNKGETRVIGDGQYNGLLCDTNKVEVCSAMRSIHVWQPTVVVFSDSFAVSPIVSYCEPIPSGASGSLPTVDSITTIRKRPCLTGSLPVKFIKDTSTLSIVVAGTTYTEAAGEVKVLENAWSLLMPTPLSAGTYSVVATFDSDGSGPSAAKTNKTSNDLIISKGTARDNADAAFNAADAAFNAAAAAFKTPETAVKSAETAVITAETAAAADPTNQALIDAVITAKATLTDANTKLTDATTALTRAKSAVSSTPDRSYNNLPSSGVIDLNGCYGETQSVYLTVKDINGNVLPVGTTITASESENGKLVGGTGFVVGSTNELVDRAGYVVQIAGDGTIDADTGECKDTKKAGVLSIKIKTLKNNETNVAITLRN